LAADDDVKLPRHEAAYPTDVIGAEMEGRVLDVL